MNNKLQPQIDVKEFVSIKKILDTALAEKGLMKSYLGHKYMAKDAKSFFYKFTLRENNDIIQPYE